MKRNIKSLLALAIATLHISFAFAQYTNSGYFTKGYSFRHELNPAFGNEDSYFAMPALANINIASHTTLSLEDIFYNVNGKTTTFLNPNVSANEFLSNVKEKNNLTTDYKMEILSIGSYGERGYTTVGLNLRAQANASVPGSLFRLLKEGKMNETYDISAFNLNAKAYAEIAIGHSRKINDKLRIGATVKGLIGLGEIDAKFNQAYFTLGEKEWTAVTDAEINTSIKGFSYKTSKSSKTGKKYVSGGDVDKFGIGGFGAAVDLGAEYKLGKDWVFSLAILDLGLIKWNYNSLASTNGEQTFTTDKYVFSLDDNADNSFKKEFDNLTEGLAALYELENKGDDGGRSSMLSPTINAAVEYILPVYRKVSFGVMNSTRIQENYTWTEFRASANYAPSDWFTMTANFATGTYGPTAGWMLCLHPTGINLFLGMDYMPRKYDKNNIPLTNNYNFNFGLAFIF